MVVSDTVDVVLHVHREGHPIQALIAHGAPEAARVVGFAQSLKDLRVGGTEGSVEGGGVSQQRPLQGLRISEGLRDLKRLSPSP